MLRRIGVCLILLLLTGWGLFPSRIWAGECMCPPESEILPGTEGPDIIELQYFLRSLGFFAGEPTGSYDQLTSKAVEEFQSLHNLRVTGKVDSDTWQALGEMSPGDPVAGNPPSGNVEILVDTDYLSLSVLVDGKPFKSFPVAIGKPSTPTPVGSWTVVDKGKWSGGFGTRWIGLNIPFGRFGIHGTNKPWSIGRMESHGCIRMYNRDVEQLYRWVGHGTKVYITGDPFRSRRRLLRGEKGSDVFFLQKRLRQLGFYQHRPDGVFGYETEQALKKFQQEEGLPVTGQVGWAEYKRLRLFIEE